MGSASTSRAGYSRGQLLGTGPVGGDPTTVQQAGFGGQEGPGAHRGHPTAPRGHLGDPGHQRGVGPGGQGLVPAGEDQGVDGLSGAGSGSVHRLRPLSVRTGPPSAETSEVR